MKLCIVQPSVGVTSETFLAAHAIHLPGVVGVVNRDGVIPVIDGEPVLPQGIAACAGRKVLRIAFNRPWQWEITHGFVKAFRSFDADVVLAEYGPTGVAVLDACQYAGLPLVVHFHGYDASNYATLEEHRESYKRLFLRAAAVVVVSHTMRLQIRRMECPDEKLVTNPYGVETKRFVGADPASAPPTFLAVGRMVDKKAPHLTLLAFARLLEDVPDARLRMVGDGPLLGICRDLSKALRIGRAVEFLGELNHAQIACEMRSVRAFVQHSVIAINGDSEGTPVAVLEAGASGLPVIATRHAGISEIVLDGTSGFLVDEHDVERMAEHMKTLAQQPQLAGEMGRRASARARTIYSMESSIARLSCVVQAAAARQPIDSVRKSIEFELAAATDGTTSDSLAEGTAACG